MKVYSSSLLFHEPPPAQRWWEKVRNECIYGECEARVGKGERWNQKRNKIHTLSLSDSYNGTLVPYWFGASVKKNIRCNLTLAICLNRCLVWFFVHSHRLFVQPQISCKTKHDIANALINILNFHTYNVFGFDCNCGSKPFKDIVVIFSLYITTMHMK